MRTGDSGNPERERERLQREPAVNAALRPRTVAIERESD